MNRSLIAFLFRCWLVELLPALCLGWLFFFNLLWREPVTHLLALMVALTASRTFVSWVAYGEWRPSLWLWRVSHRVVGFCTLTSNQVLLLFPFGLDEAIELQEIIQWSEIRLGRSLTTVRHSSPTPFNCRPGFQPSGTHGGLRATHGGHRIAGRQRCGARR